MGEPKVDHLEQDPAESELVVVTNDDGSKETFVTQEVGKIVQVKKKPLEIGVFDRRIQLQDLADASDADRREIQSMLLLKKKQEMTQLQNDLEDKRAEFTRRMELSRAKREELCAKQAHFRERVCKFEKFLKESDAKRQRANDKALSERRAREQKEVEYEQLQSQLRELTNTLESTRVQISRHKVYETYLQTVLKKTPSDQLDSNDPQIHDLIQRFQTVKDSNRDLLDALQSYQDQIEEQQSARTIMVKEKNDHILVSNSELSRLQKHLDSLKQQHSYLVLKMEGKESVGKERARNMGAIKLAIDNLFERLGGRSTFLFAKTSQASEPAPTLSAVKDATVVEEHAVDSSVTFVTQNQGNFLSPTGLGNPQQHHAPNTPGTPQGPSASAERNLSLVDKLQTIQEKMLDFQGIVNRLLAVEKATKRSQQRAALQQQHQVEKSKHAEEFKHSGAGANSGNVDSIYDSKLRVVKVPVIMADPIQAFGGSNGSFPSSTNASLLSVNVASTQSINRATGLSSRKLFKSNSSGR